MISRLLLFAFTRAHKPSVLFAFVLAHSFLSTAEVSPWGRFVTSTAIVSNSATRKIYAVCEGANSVAVIDAVSGRRRAVMVGREPIAIAINLRTNRIYVANSGDASVSVIDGRSDAVEAIIAVARLPYTMALDETTNRIYVSHTYAGVVTMIDGATSKAIPLKIGDADGVAVDPQNGKVFLYTYEDSYVRILDEATGAVTKVGVGPHIWGMVFDESTATLYLAHTATNEIVALHENSLSVSTIPVGKIPCALAVDPETRKLFVANYGDNTVSIIDLQTRRVSRTLPVGRHPQGLAIDFKSKRVFVANLHEDSLTVIDGAKNAVTSTLHAGSRPYAVAVDLQSGTPYAANYSSPWVTKVVVSK